MRSGTVVVATADPAMVKLRAALPDPPSNVGAVTWYAADSRRGVEMGRVAFERCGPDVEAVVCLPE